MSVSGVSKLSQRNSFRACGGEGETDGKCGFSLSLSLSPSPFLAVGLTVISYSFNLGFHFFLCCFPSVHLMPYHGLVCTQDNHYFSTSIKRTRFASHPPSLAIPQNHPNNLPLLVMVAHNSEDRSSPRGCPVSLPPSANKLKGLCARMRI